MPVPSGDEGWVEPATTQSATPSGPNPPVYVPEYLLRWSGWSLAAARPGKHLSDIPSDGLEADEANPANGNIPLQVDYAAAPGTLPTLRFGHTYRFRARAVDLAGNSVPFTKSGPFTWATPEVTYRRFEPVPSPVLVPTAPRTPGEHLENLVIRSNYDVPDDDPSIVACERHIVPPSTGEDMAETHGVLDGPDGHPEASSYALIADRDGLTYKSPSVLSLYGGQIDSQSLNGKNEWVYYPPVATPTTSNPAFGVPYLPDVLAKGVALLNLPGKKDAFVRAPFNTLGVWPNRRAVRLVVSAGSGAPVLPAPSDLDGAILVKAPKASITPVLMSSYFEPADLEVMALWQWIVEAGKATPALGALILDRLHYMFTPYRELVIVHAVRQPLTPPVIEKLIVVRPYGATYALLSGVARAEVQSTIRVDVLAAWADPYDDGTSPEGAVLLDKTSRVDEIPLSIGQSDVIVVDKIRHDFGDTQHHEVFYSAVATTRFLEYFTEIVTETLTGSTPVVCSGAGFAPGTVDVRAAADTATIYRSGVDFTEDDKKGSIARITTGSIPDNASVAVQFVAPPVTRSSLEKDAHPPTVFGYLRSIPSTARPPAPDVRYLIPAWNWVTQPSTSAPSSSRVGNVLRVYLGRPWFQSGIGELLGVVVANPPPGAVLPAGSAAIRQWFRVGSGIRDGLGRHPAGDRLRSRDPQGDGARLGGADGPCPLGGRRGTRSQLRQRAPPVVRRHLHWSGGVVLPLRQTGARALSAVLAAGHRAVPGRAGRLHPTHPQQVDGVDLSLQHRGERGGARSRIPRNLVERHARHDAGLPATKDRRDERSRPAMDNRPGPGRRHGSQRRELEHDKYRLEGHGDSPKGAGHGPLQDPCG